MNRWIALLALVGMVAGCGEAGARSGGTLTTPAPTTTSSTAPVASTAPPSTTAATPSTTSTTSTTTPPETSRTTVTVYFLEGGGRAVAVTRVVEGPGVARGAVEALVAGPNNSETASGLTTAFPPDSLVLGLTIEGGTATVDMSLEFEAGGGSASVLGRLAQLVYTLTEFDRVERVRLLIEGEPVEIFSGEGVVVSEPLIRADYAGSFPIAQDAPAPAAPTWDQDDLDAMAGGGGTPHNVVLVAADDFLNVRHTAGVDGEIVGRLLPGVAVAATGDTSRVGSSTWQEIHTPAGEGWVNGFYLTSAEQSSFEPAALELIADLSQRFAAGADFTSIVSPRGLWVAHHSAPIRFDHDELDGILDDRTTYRWGSNALEPGSPEIPLRTFSEAVAARFVGAYDDPDRDVLVGETVEGPNGRPRQFALPSEFGGFPFVTIFDPGDDPQYGGLDWTSWIVSFAYENGAWKIVGLTLDEWAP